ncbi:MAG: hypothetical protein V1807_00535 [Patescibacteria group bacterium]
MRFLDPSHARGRQARNDTDMGDDINLLGGFFIGFCGQNSGGVEVVYWLDITTILWHLLRSHLANSPLFTGILFAKSICSHRLRTQWSSAGQGPGEGGL